MLAVPAVVLAGGGSVVVVGSVVDGVGDKHCACLDQRLELAFLGVRVVPDVVLVQIVAGLVGPTVVVEREHRHVAAGVVLAVLLAVQLAVLPVVVGVVVVVAGFAAVWLDLWSEL